MNRRLLLALAAALSPASTALLAACAEPAAWPAGMQAFKWDRDTCARCRMMISDRRFAVQVRSGPNDAAFKFDDIGCAVLWLDDKRSELPWTADAATRYWVAEFGGRGERWLDARRAHYRPGARSPMGYDLEAHPTAQAGDLDYAAAGARIRAAKSMKGSS